MHKKFDIGDHMVGSEELILDQIHKVLEDPKLADRNTVEKMKVSDFIILNNQGGLYVDQKIGNLTTEKFRRQMYEFLELYHFIYPTNFPELTEDPEK